MLSASLTPHSAIEAGIAHFLQSLGAPDADRAPRTERTRCAYGVDLDQFARFLHTCVAGPAVGNVTPRAVAAFAEHLQQLGRAPRTVARKLAAVRALFRFLCARGVCAHDPSRRVRAPAAPPAPPPPTPEEIGALLALPESSSFAGARNRALMEVLYGAGLRLSDAVALNLSQLSFEDGRLHLRRPSTHPLELGQRATAAVQAYLLRRAETLVARDVSTLEAGALFVSRRGRRLHPRSVQQIVGRYLRVLETPSEPTEGDRTPSPPPAPGRRRHLGPGQLRAACAQHLIDAGADPGLVALLLQRAGLPSPAHGDPERLANRYRQAHPRA